MPIFCEVRVAQSLVFCVVFCCQLFLFVFLFFFFEHCIVCPSNYGFCLPFWHLQTFIIYYAKSWQHKLTKMSDNMLLTPKLYPTIVGFKTGFKWEICCSIFSFQCSVLQIIVCPFSFGHCIVYRSIYGFWLPLWYLRFTASGYPFGIFKLVLWYTINANWTNTVKIYCLGLKLYQLLCCTTTKTNIIVFLKFY